MIIKIAYILIIGSSLDSIKIQRSPCRNVKIHNKTKNSS